MNWKGLESYVRTLAALIWDREAKAENIAGVNFDCVLKIEPDYWVIVEITKEDTLEKLRTDLAKFAVARPALFQRNIFPKCLFVTEKTPNPSLIVTGRELTVDVLSYSELAGRFFDFAKYHFARSSRRFGSAVDPVTGDPDRREFVPVRYNLKSSGDTVSISEIGKMISGGRHVILLGNYGTGKSRCIQQLFSQYFTPEATEQGAAFAIDLRDNWGVKRATEIMRRHVEDLGLSSLADAAVKLSITVHTHLLLDGFDEIGSQAWGRDPKALKEIRRDAVQGVKDLISKSKGGLLITGRSHYFNSDEEMFSALGLNPKTTTVIECPDEFTPAEMESYLQRISPALILPSWLPRRPLICQIVNTLPLDEIDRLLGADTDELGFWRALLELICKRECQINPSLDPVTVKAVLLKLARLARSKAYDVGPITLEDLDRVFGEVVGQSAVEASSTMLQRLATLGRVSAESSERQFIDGYILDGLRAEDVITYLTHPDEKTRTELWRHPLKDFGLTLVGQHLVATGGQPHSLKLIAHTSRFPNVVLTSDIISAWLLRAKGEVDFTGIVISGAEIHHFSFAALIIKNLKLDTCVIGKLSVASAVVHGVEISDTEISILDGVSADRRIPDYLKNCSINTVAALDTVARIKSADLKEAHRILITILKKTFFQPGGGREEEALLRGFGRLGSPKLPDRILNILMKEGILERFKGAEGWVYKPVRSKTARMQALLSSLTVSDDPIWAHVDKL